MVIMPRWRRRCEGASNSTGLSMPRLVWRRRGLYQASIHSKIAEASCCWVAQRCAVEQLALHGRPERFHHRVVDAGGDAAHRAEQPGLAQPVAEDPTGVLTLPRSECTIVPGCGLAAPGGHLQGVDDQLGAHVVGDRPAHDAAGEHVEDGAAVDLPGRRWGVR